MRSSLVFNQIVPEVPHVFRQLEPDFSISGEGNTKETRCPCLADTMEGSDTCICPVQELEDAQEANGSGVHDRTKAERVGSKRERNDNHGRHELKDRHGKSGPHARNLFVNTSSVVTRERRAPKEETVKEEGEISDADNTPQPRRGRKNPDDREDKETKWHEWCAEMMHDQARTLKSLEKLQTAFDLSKEEVFWVEVAPSNVEMKIVKKDLILTCS